jgi:hypothetical protein
MNSSATSDPDTDTFTSLQSLLRALEAEAEALQKIHVRIQKQLQSLEVRLHMYAWFLL